MPGPHRRRVWHKLAASVAVLASVSVFVSFGVFSAFDSTQANTSSLGAGTLSLDDNLATSTLVDISNLIPGDIVTRCVKVTNTGNVPADVTVTPTAVGTLAGAITAKVQEGTGLTGTDGDCAGFNATGYILGTSADATTLATALTAKPVEEWSASATKSYRLVLTLPSTVSNTLQAATGSLEITWSAAQKAGTNR